MEFSGISDEAGKSIESQARAHNVLGWKLIDLRNIEGKCVTDVSDVEFDRILETVTNAGLEISCFCSQIGNWSRKITGDFQVDRAELLRAVPRMHNAGTKLLRIMSWLKGEATVEEWRAEAIRRVKDLAKVAEAEGLVIAHEICSGWASQGPDEAIELLEKVNSPALVLIYDTANPLSHGKDTWAFVQGVKDHTAYLHIKDWKVGPDGKGHGVYPGEGDSMLREQLAVLFGAGYDGVIVIEPHVASIVHEGKEAGDPDAAFKCYVEYGRRLMKLVGEVKKSL